MTDFENQKKKKLCLYFSRIGVLVLGLLLVTISALYAQNVTVKGKVIDAQTNEGIPGVNVVQNGTTNGVVTNFDGEYQIDIPASASLLFSFIGYTNQLIELNGKTVIDVSLGMDTKQLDEVIAIGYGSVRRKDVTGAISTISGESLQKIPLTNPAEAISGRLAGVNVTTADGSPDAEILIRVRGGGSVTGSNAPLIIVDGFPVDKLNDIATSDIEDLVVLKDAASTAIYGSQGANGVILVTTKSAKGGKTTVSYNGFIKGKNVSKRLETLNTYDYVLYQYEKYAMGGEDGIKSFQNRFGVYDDIDLYKYMEPFDGQDDLFGNGTLSKQHNISVMGGNEKTKFALTGIYDNNTGLMVNDGYERFYINFKLNHQITKNVKLNLNARITDTQIDGSGTSGDSYKVRTTDGIMYPATQGLSEFTVVDLAELSDEEREEYINANMTIAERAEQYWKQKKQTGFNLTAGLQWDILKNLVYRVDAGYSYGFNETKRYWGEITNNASYVDGKPLVDWTKQNTIKMRLAQTLNYDTKIGKHGINAMVGQEMINNGNNNNYVYATSFSTDLSPEKIFANMALSSSNLKVNSYVSPQDKLLSYFSRVGYNYAEKYLFTLTMRADGSSKFKKGNRWGYFPAAAVAWRINQEEFMAVTKAYLSNLKLRLSYGTSGNNDIASTLYQLDYSISSSKPYGYGDAASNYYKATNSEMANPNLKWETTITRNIGLDFGFFDSKLNGTIDLYSNSVKDLLIRHDIVAPGYSAMYENIGETANKGVELTLDAMIVSKKDFTLSANFNIGHNKAEVVKLAEGADYMEFGSGWAGTDLKGTYDFRVMVGEPVGVLYGWESDGYYTTNDFESYSESTGYVLKDGVPTTGLLGGSIGIRPGTMKLKDQTGNNVVDADDRVVLGNTTPKFSGGFGMFSTFKNFDLSVMFSYVYGNKVYNASKIAASSGYRNSLGNLLSFMSLDNSYSYLDVETGELVYELDELATMNEGENAKEYWSALSTGNAVALTHSWAIEDGSFIRLQNISLGYTLPRKLTNKFACQQLRFYATLNNVFCLTNYTGYDPEVSSPVRSSSVSNLTRGVDYSSYPKSLSWVLGVNITF